MDELTIERILASVVRESQTRWTANLVSVVLFGSSARGDAQRHSDLDLLLVVEDLPIDWRARSALELSFEQLGLKWGKPLQVILVEPAEMRQAVADLMPLLLELGTGYRCLLDRDGFFQSEMQRLENLLAQRGVRQLAAHKWEIPEHAHA